MVLNRCHFVNIAAINILFLAPEAEDREIFLQSRKCMCKKTVSKILALFRILQKFYKNYEFSIFTQEKVIRCVFHRLRPSAAGDSETL